MSGNMKNICDHIRNVRKSLQSAEESFRRHNDMRGELDLMLAEAEMQHLREKRGPGAFFNRQILAIAAAFVLVLSGIGGWWWAQGGTAPPELAVSAAQDPQIIAVKELPAAVTPAEKMAESFEVTGAVVRPPVQAVVAASEGNAVITASAVPIEENELRDLVRTARKTLNAN